MASTEVLASLSIRIGAITADFEKALASTQKQLKKFGEDMSDVGESLSKKLSAPLAIFGGLALKTAGDMQALRKGLQAVLPAGASLNDELSKLRETAKLPGLGLKEAIQGSINLQAAGFSAELSRKALEGFGNALATVGKGKADLEGVATALSQMAAKGKISAEEIGQISERVPQIRQVLNDAFGTSEGKALEALGVSATEFVERVSTELNKLPKVTGGINNAFENMGDTVTIALDTIGTRANELFNIEGFFNKLADVVSGLTDKFSQLSPTTQKVVFVLAAVAAGIGPLLVGLGFLTTTILPALTAGFKTLSVVASPIVLKIAAIVAAVAALALVAKSIYDAWGPIASFFKGIFNQVQLSVANGLLSIIESVEGVSSKIGITFDSAKAAIKGFAADAKKSLDAAPVTSFGDAAGAVGTAIKDNFNAITSIFRSTGEAASGTAEAFGTAAPAMQKVAQLSDEQKKALASLRSELALIDNQARLFGDSYDYIGEKASALTKGLEQLLKSGFAPQSKVIQDLKTQLDTLGLDRQIEFGSIDSLGFNADQFQVMQAGATALADTFNGALTPALTNVATGIQGISLQGQTFDLLPEEMVQRALSATQAIQDAITSAKINVVADFAEMAGAALATGEGFNNLPKLILGVLFDLAAQVGRIVIGMGFAVESVKTALASLTGIGAIAAGAALLAIAGAGKAALSRAGSSAGGGGGGASPRVSEPLAKTSTSSQVQVTGTTITKGRDLVTIFETEKKAQNRTT